MFGKQKGCTARCSGSAEFLEHDFINCSCEVLGFTSTDSLVHVYFTGGLSKLWQIDRFHRSKGKGELRVTSKEFYVLCYSISTIFCSNSTISCHSVKPASSIASLLLLFRDWGLSLM